MGLTLMANSDVDGGAAPDLPAGWRRVSERPSGWGVGAAEALIPPARPGERLRRPDMPAAMNAILYFAYGLPMALSAAL